MRLIAFLLFFTSTQALAYDFKELKLGTELTEIQNSGKFTCTAAKTPVAEMGCYLKRGQTDTIAGAKITLLVLFINDSKVTTISVDFDHKDFNAISNAFIAKYGKPLTDEIKTISNHMGAEFDSRVLEWVDDTSVLLLKERSRKISNSNARFSLKQNIEDMGKRFEEDAAKRANDL